jgi:hypothetical protein
MRIHVTVLVAVLTGVTGVEAMATSSDAGTTDDQQHPDTAAVPPALPQPPPGNPPLPLPPPPPPPRDCGTFCVFIEGYGCVCNGPLHTGFTVDDEIRTIESIEIVDDECAVR